MANITKSDLEFINEISSRTYTGNAFLNNGSQDEKDNLRLIKTKLRNLAGYFNQKYTADYGPLVTSVVTGNDIALGGTRLKRIWSGIFKGNTNKQYSAQVSFVISSTEPCLYVGFWFGRAHGHSVTRPEQLRLEGELQDLAIKVSDRIINDELFREKYFLLGDLGFTPWSAHARIGFNDWYSSIRNNASTSQILVRVFPDDTGEISLPVLDFYVSQIIFLMSAINAAGVVQPVRKISADQRLKQLARLAEIGLKGEKYIFDLEYRRLQGTGRIPDHVSLKSDRLGYDILSYENGEEIFIEVKTTCRANGDYNFNRFFLSFNEHNVYKDNPEKYRLYRVFDIENNPGFEVLNMSELTLISDGYVCTYTSAIFPQPG